jgi:hypothetical protein
MFMNDPLFDVVNAVGSPVSGAKAYFYLTGTDTLTDTYTSETLTTPNANPVIADSAGRFPSIYLDPTISYRLKVFDENDVLIADRDPIAQSNYFARTGFANTFTAAQTVQARVNFRDATFYADYVVGDSTLPHINFDGNDYLYYDRTNNFLSLTIGGSEKLRITSTTARFPGIGTTASAANAFLDSGNGNEILRSTSSRKYKTQIEPLAAAYARNALRLAPVWYRSSVPHDRSEWSWYGLIAEEVAEIDPRLVHWHTDEDTGETVPDGVQYERLSVLLLHLVKEMRAELDAIKGQAPEPEPVPVELASFAQPDETPQETKDRLMQALSNLRSMAVGQIPMTDTEKAMLTTLEGAVAQQWFRA